MIPFPGTASAKEQGCICPTQTPQLGRSTERLGLTWTFKTTCPLHGAGDWTDRNIAEAAATPPVALPEPKPGTEIDRDVPPRPSRCDTCGRSDQDSAVQIHRCDAIAKWICARCYFALR